MKNILVNINKGYVPHFLAMLNSLSKNNPGEQFKVFVMHSQLDDDDKNYIKTRIAENIKLKYIFMKSELFKGAPKVKRYPYEIYYRIFAPLMLPKSVKRVLYLDSDLIVHGDISNLYNMDFEDNYFIACTQIRKFLQDFNRFRMGVDKNHYYMNTGVMVMDIEKLRPLINAKEIFEFIKSNGWRMFLYDQDVLFKFFGDKIKLVDARIYNLSDRLITFNNRRKKAQKIDLDWVEKNNVIIHYLGRNKPWKDNYKGILKDYYKRYEVK